MDFYDVIAQLAESLPLMTALLAVALTCLLYWLGLRGAIASVLDPLAIVVVLSAVASSFLVVLTLMGFVSVAKTAFVVFVLVLLYAPLALAARRSPAPGRRPGGHLGFEAPRGAQLWLLLVMHVALQMTIYASFGIPLLADSRLTTYAESGGGGVLGRLKDGIEFVGLVLAFIHIARGRRVSPAAWLLVASTIGSLLLSGSKGAFLNLAFAWYLGHVYRTGRWSLPAWSRRRWLALTAVAVAIPLGVIGLQSATLGDGGPGVLQALAMRVVAEGDGYAYFLGGDRIDALRRSDPWAIVRPVLTTLRLTPADEAVTPGFEILRDLFGDESGLWGPNTRLPIFILFFYGAPGLILAVLGGVALLCSRRLVWRGVRRRPLRFAVLSSVYLATARFEIDPQGTVNAWLNLVLVLPLLAPIWALKGPAPEPRLPGLALARAT